MDSFIDITGLEGITRDIADLPEAIVRDLFPDALSAGGAVLEDELRSRTPKSLKLTTSAKEYGTLEADIATDVAVDQRHLAGRAKVGFGVTGYKARFVEYGHREVTHAGRDVGQAQATPFMRLSAEAGAEAAADAFVNALAENK